MPQVVPFVLAAAKAFAAKILTALVVQAAASVIQGALSKGAPSPEQAKIQFRQPIPPAQIGFGRCRMSGPNLLFGTFGKYTADVIAIAVGPIDAFEAFYLNDDLVPIGTLFDGGYVPMGSDGRYGFRKVFIETRLGAFPSPVYSNIISRVGDADVWGPSHRADGVATIAMTTQSVKSEDLTKVYPNYEISLSAVGRWMKCYDWRKDSTAGGSGAHRRNLPGTWEWTQNAVVTFVHDEWFNRGQDWDYRFAPTLAFATAAANVCDEAVPLKAGGTEPRYTSNGWYEGNNPPKNIRQLWFDTFDGYMIERGDGAYVIHAGKYVAPTVTLNEDRILECEWRRSRRGEDVANRLVLSYCSPEHGYTMVEADAWVDQADIDARGFEKSAGFDRQWVTSNGQVRRLAKRAMSRLAAVYGGYVIVPLSDDEAELEQRYIRIQNRRGPASMHDVVCEIIGATVDLARNRVRFDIIKADVNIDAWNPATEEGSAPDVVTPPAPTVVPVPLVESVTAFTDDAGQGILAPRLTVTMTDQDRDDLTYVVSWRTPSDNAFTDEASRTAVDDGVTPPTVSFNSGFVPSIPALEVRVQAISAGGTSEWVYYDIGLAPLIVDTTVGVGRPTNVTAADLTTSPNGARITWRNPFGVFAYVRIYRNTTNNFGTASLISGDIVGGSGQVQGIDDILTPGTYWWWVVAYDTGGNPGTPSVPATTTVV